MSTTIHVTIDDHTEALGVVATLLNQGYQVSIDIDVVANLVEPVHAPMNNDPNYMSREEFEMHERLWGDKIEKAKRRNETLIRKLQSRDRIEAVPARVWDEDRRIIEEMRQKERQMALEVACPNCGAGPNDFCRSAGGHRYNESFVHVDRIQASMPVQA